MAREQKIGFWLALFLSVGLTLVAGVIYGQYSQRWGPATDLLAAAKHLETMPKEIGRWQLAEDLILEEAVVEMLECAGYVNRRYVNNETGQVVTLAIIVGPPGPTAVHTPEICYSSQAYRHHNPRQVVTIGESPLTHDQFWGVTFEANSHLADDLNVYYAWSKGKQWEASKSPRFEYAAQPMLFKLQLAGSVETGINQEGRDICQDFLEALQNLDWELTSS